MFFVAADFFIYRDIEVNGKNDKQRFRNYYNSSVKKAYLRKDDGCSSRQSRGHDDANFSDLGLVTTSVQVSVGAKLTVSP